MKGEEKMQKKTMISISERENVVSLRTYSRAHQRSNNFFLMNYPAASCGVSKVATSTYNPICYTALFPLRFYRLFYNFSPAPVLSHTCL